MYLYTDKIIGINDAVDKIFIISVLLEYVLIVEEHADLISGDQALFQHGSIDDLRETAGFRQLKKYKLGHGRINFIGSEKYFADIQSRQRYSTFADGIMEIIIEACLTCYPLLIDLIIRG